MQGAPRSQTAARKGRSLRARSVQFGSGLSSRVCVRVCVFAIYYLLSIELANAGVSELVFFFTSGASRACLRALLSVAGD